MSAAKHTPGPWRWWTSNSFRRLSSDATGRDGDVLCAVVQPSDGHPDIHFTNGGPEGPDARLIAAAPELLAALQRLLPAYREAVKLYDINHDDAFTVDAHNAIAKATGSTT